MPSVKSEGVLRRRRRRRERRREIRGDAGTLIRISAAPRPAPAPPIPDPADAGPKVGVISVLGLSAEKLAILTYEELKRRCGDRVHPCTRPQEFWADDLGSTS